MRRKVMRRSACFGALFVIALSLTACGSGGDDLDVIVLTGSELAPSEGPDAEPSAYLLAGGDGVQFVSAPLYSGSCPPEAEVSQDGDTITLNIDAEQSGDCTADGGPYTFIMSADPDAVPTQLVVEESGQDDIRLELAGP